MVKKFLKIAGVKSEAEFYKKYPSEAAFFKAHPEAKDLKQYKQGGQQKKLNQLTSFEGDVDNIMPIGQMGSIISQTPAAQLFQPIDFQELKDSYDQQMTGSTDAKRRAAQQEAQAAAQQQGSGGGGGGMDMSQIMKMVGGAEGGAGGAEALASLPIGKKGKKLKKGQTGLGLNSPAGGTMTGVTAAGTNPYMWNSNPNIGDPIASTAANASTPATAVGQTPAVSGSVGQLPPPESSEVGKLASAIPVIGGIVSGIEGLFNEREMRKRAEQQKELSDLTLQASMLKPEKAQRRYVRPEDSIVQPEQLFPSYGVGTNVLARNGSVLKAQNGTDESYEKLKEYGSAAYDQMDPFYETLYGAANKYKNEKTGKVSDLNSARATVKAFLKHPEVLLMKRHQLPSELTSMESNPYGVQSYTTPVTGGWYPTQWGEPVKGLGIGKFFGNIGENIGNFFEERKIRRQTNRGIRRQRSCFYGKCYDEEGNVTPEAEDGMQIGGNLTEIQNMYNPGDLYEDLGYEPLSESDVIKQYQGGGTIDPGLAGGLNLLGSFSGQIGGALGGGGFEANAGTDTGGAIGGAIGNAIAPGVGGMVGNIAGSLIGGALNQAPRKIKAAQEATRKNVEKAAAYSASQALQRQYSAHVKNGGWVSNDWLPQVITKFGEYDVKDLLKEDPTMDTLRTGGHIRQNYSYPQDQFNLGGSLQTTWGGYAEPISQNPYLPGTGETVMFRGKSHEERDRKGRTGIGVKYGGEDGEYSPYMEYGRDGVEDVTDVEVERGEPAMELPDGETGENSMVVFGNLKIPKQFIPEAGGKKFKNYVNSLSQKENKLSKSLDKDVETLDSLEIYTPFDKLKMDALQANLMGKNMKLKKIADKKTEAASVQSALNDTASEYGLDADSLAKGKVKIDKKAQQEMAKFGKDIFKAQDGGKYKIIGKQAGSIDYNPLGQAGDELWTKENYDKLWKPKVKDAFDDPIKSRQIISDLENYTGQDFADVQAALAKEKTFEGKVNVAKKLATDKKVGPYHQIINELIETKRPIDPAQKIPFGTPGELKPKFRDIPRIPEETINKIPEKGGFDWTGLINQITPFFRPTDVDYDVDLSPEMMALSMNQLEPVDAQLYQPQLLTPYDVSYQDQLNEVTAQSRAAERMAGGDPAALASIMGQASRAKSSILGEQFRQNQAQRMGVYNQNIGTLNDAQLKNLAILDEQAKRQAMARSNTKAQALEAAKSVSDKIAKNRLENRTLQTYENLYNFRYGPQGRAINYNPLAQFNTTVGGSGSSKGGGLAPGYEFTYDSTGNIIGTRKSSKKDDDARNGRIVKAMKGY